MAQTVFTNAGVPQASHRMDYVADGVIYRGVYVSVILVGDEDDLEDLTGYEPGSVAHTAGWKQAWELGVDGETWVSFDEEEEDDHQNDEIVS